jgi:hypothetical protein
MAARLLSLELAGVALAESIGKLRCGWTGKGGAKGGWRADFERLER